MTHFGQEFAGPTGNQQGMRTVLVALLLACTLATPAFGVLGRSDVLAGHGDHTHAHLGTVEGCPLGTALDEWTTGLFWETPWVACTGEPGLTGISAAPDCDQGESFTYELELAEDIDQLRVDMDYPYRQDDFVLTVTGPDGTSASQASHNTYSEGVRIEGPAVGTWTVELAVTRTAGAIVRMRAGAGVTAPPEGDELLPNLRVTPPFELGFAAPINPANSLFLAGDDQNPGVSVGGTPLYSCTVDEVQEAADPTRTDDPTVLTRCLRFTAGPHNVGEGHFDLRFPILDRAMNDRDRLVEMTQVVHHADGSTTERDAGSYEYHATHGHYHYTDILFYELLSVDAAARTVSPAGVGHKSGFCPADQGYGEWTAFDQDTGGALGSIQSGDCFAIAGDGAMGITAGWGDFYRWQRPGQFVDFSGQPDGEYVVRATVDVLDQVAETDEDDNASYTWVRVTGDEVEILERGYGSSPFDPEKVVATDNRGQYPLYGLDRLVQ